MPVPSFIILLLGTSATYLIGAGTVTVSDNVKVVNLWRYEYAINVTNLYCAGINIPHSGCVMESDTGAVYLTWKHTTQNNDLNT